MDYQNVSAFIRAALKRELEGRESAIDEAEGRELRSVRLWQQAEFAFLDALVRTTLTHLTELPRDTYDQAVARGIVRYKGS